MKYKTLFRLMLKAVGALIIGQSAGLFVSTVFGIILWRINNDGTTTFAPYDVQSYYATLLQPAVEMGVGLYLLVGGRWIADLAIPSNRPYCHECGYDLTGAAGHACAECGTAFQADAPSSDPAAL